MTNADDILPPTLELLEPYRGAKLHHRIRCTVCSHEWEATPLSKRQAWKKRGIAGCPSCHRRRAEERDQLSRERWPELIQQLQPSLTFDPKDVLASRRNKNSKITVRNVRCGHSFTAAMTNLLYVTIDCPICNKAAKAERLTANSKARSAVVQQTIGAWAAYKYEVRRLSEANAIAAGLDLSRRGRAGVRGATQLDHIVPIRKCFDASVPASVCADVSNLRILSWRENVSKRDRIAHIPPILLPYLAGAPKHDVFGEVRDVCTIEGWQVIDEPHQITICPTPTLQVVIKSLSHHVQQLRPYNANVLELEDAQSRGITQLQYFDDEWVASKNLIIAKIKHLCGVSAARRIHARKCVIAPVTSITQKKRFLERNHIQGNVRGRVVIGAWHGDTLIAVAVFDHRKKMNSGSHDTSTWELVRLCVDVDVICSGIGSRLVHHFFSTHPDVQSVITYRDLRNTTGASYAPMGFVVERRSPPSYRYVVNGRREHRWKYRKSALGDIGDKTEYQVMLERGIDRVWDCGTERLRMLRPNRHI